MKIGILTFHRAHNYGAFMQAFALKTYIESLGHKAVFIDYVDKNHHSLYSLWQLEKRSKNKFTIIKNMKLYTKKIILLIPRYIRYKKFSNDSSVYLGVDQKKTPIHEPENIKDICDFYVYGSDQIWRKDDFLGGFDSVLWGDYPKTNNPKVSYAASMGKMVSLEENREFINEHLNNFSAVSVREFQLKDLLLEIDPQKNITHVCDPTLLLNKETWIDKLGLKKTTSKGIIFYHLLGSDHAKKIVQKIKNEYKCNLVEFSGAVTLSRLKKHHKQLVGPVEFLNYFYNSDFVVSTSFHGVIFAIIFEKNFYAMGMDKNSYRVLSLLKELGLSDRYIADADKLPKTFPDINFVEVKKRLNKYVEKSKIFLTTSIESFVV